MVKRNKKFVFQIALLFQTTFAYDFQIDENNEYRIELEKSFGYNFYNLIDLNEVLVWKISYGPQTFKPEDNSNGFTEFGTNETFLIFTQNLKLHYNVYYWSGTETTLEEKKNVAKYAAMLFGWIIQYLFLITDNIYLAREDQMFESESFTYTLNRLRSLPYPIDGRPPKYRDEHFPLNGPNLYLVNEDQTRSIIKVPIDLGLRLLMQDACLVVESPPYIEELYPVSTFCGNGAMEHICMRAYSLVSDICQVIALFRPIDIILRRSREFRALVELLEDSSLYHPHQSNYLRDKNTIVRIQEERVLFFKNEMAFVGGQLMMTRKELLENPFIYYTDVNPNYILDSKSVAGIFFVYGDYIYTDIDEIVWSIQDAEEYLHTENLSLARPIRMRTVYIDVRNSHIDFMINVLPQPWNHNAGMI